MVPFLQTMVTLVRWGGLSSRPLVGLLGTYKHIGRISGNPCNKDQFQGPTHPNPAVGRIQSHPIPGTLEWGCQQQAPSEAPRESP